MRIPLVAAGSSRSDDERAARGDHRRAAGARFFGTKDPSAAVVAAGQPRGAQPRSRQDLSFFTIVGVVGNVRSRGLTEKAPVGAYYFPSRRTPIRTMTLVARHGRRAGVG